MFLNPRRCIFAAATALACLLAPMDASALTVQEIILMSQQGVPAEVLANIIRSADQIPELTQGDIQALQEANVPQAVQEAIQSYCTHTY